MRKQCCLSVGEIERVGEEGKELFIPKVLIQNFKFNVNVHVSNFIKF